MPKQDFKQRRQPQSYGKDQEELELEQSLFGSRKKRKLSGKSASKGQNGSTSNDDVESEDETGLLNDEDVSID